MQRTPYEVRYYNWEHLEVKIVQDIETPSTQSKSP